MSFLANLQKLLKFFAKSKPNAAEQWQQYGGEAKHAYWLFAAPVHMLLGRDSFFLSDQAPLPLTSDESTALIASLNQHFAQDGYHFYLLNDIWFLGLDTKPHISTTPVDQVVNQDIADYLPKGDDALIWAKLQNEVQMLLFSHPVNSAREAQGLPAMNSLWCHGLGEIA